MPLTSLTYTLTYIVSAKKTKKGGLSHLAHPNAVDSIDDTQAEDKLREKMDDLDGDFSASIVIGLLLIIPIIIIVAVTVFMRLKKNGMNFDIVDRCTFRFYTHL